MVIIKKRKIEFDYEISFYYYYWFNWYGNAY